MSDRGLWQKGIDEARRRRQSLEVSSDNAAKEDEIHNYVAAVRKKSGVSSLWFGEKFEDLVDSDATPDISLSSTNSREVNAKSSNLNSGSIRYDIDKYLVSLPASVNESVGSNNDDDDDYSYSHGSTSKEDFLANVRFLNDDDNAEKEAPFNDENTSTRRKISTDEFTSKQPRGIATIDNGDSSAVGFATQFANLNNPDDSFIIGTVGGVDISMQSKVNDGDKDDSGVTASLRKRHQDHKGRPSPSPDLVSVIEDIPSRLIPTPSQREYSSSFEDLHQTTNSTVSDEDVSVKIAVDVDGSVPPINHNRRLHLTREESTASNYLGRKSASLSQRNVDSPTTGQSHQNDIGVQTEPYRPTHHIDQVFASRERELPIPVQYSEVHLRSEMALNNMLQQQLRLTRQMIDNGRRLYEAYTSEPMPPSNFKYTTVVDTQAYIAKNKPRVRSYKEALGEAKSEQPS